jgi:hypothetical protein
MKKTYIITSVKGHHGTVTGYREAVRLAKKLQIILQAAYGVDVSRRDGSTVFTAK